MSTPTQPETRPGVKHRALAAALLARGAGRLAWDYFEKGVTAERKRDNTPVTIADREAEQFLRAGLSKDFPDDGFLGEEFGDQPGASGFRWIIDPIDGTKNFIRGIPIWATLVGLELNGEMVAGVVHVPAFDHLYLAWRGGGAFRDLKPIRVSTTDDWSESQLIYSSIDWFAKTNTTKEFLSVAGRVSRSRGFGDYYGFLLVAEGAAEIMLEPQVSPWDIAALQPIVEEAGGVFTDWHGQRTIYGQGCIVANAAMHGKVMAALRGEG